MLTEPELVELVALDGEDGARGRRTLRLVAEVREQQHRIAVLEAALEKIDAIRNSIIAHQSVNWSAHVYPLVEALREAGFEGEGYEVARAKAETLVTLTRAELLTMLPCCTHESCSEAATRAHPTAAIGNWDLRCDAHPGAMTNDYGDEAYDLNAAPLVRRVVQPVGTPS